MDPRPADLPPPPGARPSALAFFGLMLALYVVPGGLAQLASPAPGLAWTEVFAFLLPATALAAAANLRPSAFLLLARRPTAAQLALGLLCGSASFLAAGGIMGLTAAVLPLRWVQDFDLMRLFQGPRAERIALALLASVAAPLCEEAAFRGYVQNALRARLRPAGAIGAAALLFALMHLDPVRFPAVFALGCLFGWLAWRSGSLWPAVAAHAANNGIASLLAVGGAMRPAIGAPDLGLAAAMLGLGAVALLPLSAAYRAASPAPPPLEEATARGDPDDERDGLRLDRIPGPVAAALAFGALAWGVIVLAGSRAARG